MLLKHLLLPPPPKNQSSMASSSDTLQCSLEEIEKYEVAFSSSTRKDGSTEYRWGNSMSQGMTE